MSNGVNMPLLGYGVFQVSPAECERCVSDALSVGYRLIDTAQAYANEEGVGNAWRRTGQSEIIHTTRPCNRQNAARWAIFPTLQRYLL